MTTATMTATMTASIMTASARRRFFAATAVALFAATLCSSANADETERNLIDRDVSITSSLEKATSSEHRTSLLLSRGVVRQRLERFREAIEDYDAALVSVDESDPRRPVASYNRALAHRHLGNLKQAERDLTEAIILKADFPEAYYERGDLRRSTGRHVRAVLDYDLAIVYRHRPSFAAHYGKAMSHEASGERSLAVSSLRKTLEANPSYRPALEALSRLERESSVGGEFVAERFSRHEKHPIVRRETTSDASAARSSPTTSAVAAPRPSPRSGFVLADIAALAKSEAKTSTAESDDAKVGDATSTSTSTSRKLSGASPPPRVASSAKRESEELTTESVESSANLKSASSPKVAASAKSSESSERSESHGSATSFSASSPPRRLSWTVQLGARRSESAALSTWSSLRRKYSPLLDSRTPIIRKAMVRGSEFYRVRTGFERRDEAIGLCEAIKGLGGDCFVSALDPPLVLADR